MSIFVRTNLNRPSLGRSEHPNGNGVLELLFPLSPLKRRIRKEGRKEEKGVIKQFRVSHTLGVSPLSMTPIPFRQGRCTPRVCPVHTRGVSLGGD